jgi:hypothetical protein
MHPAASASRNRILPVVAAGPHKQITRRLILDPLCNDAVAQLMAKGDHRSDEGQRLLLYGNVDKERLVYLNDIDGQLL